MGQETAKRKVLIFSTAYYPFVGGAEVSINEITKRLTQGFEFDLITARLNRELPVVEKIEGVNVYRIGLGNPTLDKIILPFFGAVKAYSLSRTRDYAFFWCIMVTFGSGAAYICNILNELTLRRKVPVILTLQEGDSESHLQYRWVGFLNLSWWLALSQTDVLTSISNFLLNRAKKKGYKKESFLVPNGVDIGLFSKEVSNDIKEKIKLELGKKEGDIFLVTTGRLTHKNGVDDIVMALTKLPENINLIVIGKGEGGLDLQKQVDNLDLGQRVKFLGFKPYEEIPDYFSVCDIFIRASRSEGFGNSFIEAMAAKIPVIATPVGGIVDFLDDNKTGIFCAPNNPQSIVKAVNLILGDQLLREKIINGGYERVKERYGWDKIAIDMKSVFDKTV